MKNFFVSYKNPLTVTLVIILLGGMFAYSRLQTSLFPEITFPKIKVIADAGLQPVSKMMVTVTKPLENAIKQVPDLDYVRSTTSRGSCEISAFMDWKADIDLSQQRIESRINEIKNDLPPETQITVEKMNPSILPVMGYTLESHNRSPIELKIAGQLYHQAFPVAGGRRIRGPDHRWQDQGILDYPGCSKDEYTVHYSRHAQHGHRPNRIRQVQRLFVGLSISSI